MRTIRPFLLLAVIGLVAAACGGSASAPGIDTSGQALPDKGLSGAPPAATAAPAEPKPGEGDGGQIAFVDDAKIIRTGTMTLDVSDVGSAVRTARDAIIGLGGYVGASNTSNEDDRPTAQITYRIPVARWEAALDALRSLNGLTTNVVTEHTEAVEVTSQVIDLDARIANLEASETALQAISAQATKISDILDVQARLTETRGQIEQLAAQRKELNDRSAYATLTVSFNVPVVAVDVAAKGWDPAEVVDAALAATVSVLQGVATAGIWFVIVWLPILAVLGAISAGVVAVVRRLNLGRRMAGGPPAAPSDGGATGWR